jgi:hypothetical protein
MTEELAGREDQAFSRRIHGGICGSLDDVEALEVGPHRVGGIGKFAVSEGIGRQQIAELVVEVGLGNAENGDEGSADDDHAETDDEDREVFAP